MFDIHTRHGASAAGDYQIERSLRFTASDTTYLSRTSSGVVSTYTLSMWVKRGRATIEDNIWQVPFDSNGSSQAGGNSGFYFKRYGAELQIDAHISGGGTSTASIEIFRDPSAWYHIVLQNNSNVATVYVNNVLVTWTGAVTCFPLDNGTNETRIGSRNDGYYPFEGYIADVHLVDGSVVAPSSFAEVDDDTGQWVPKKYVGSYGSNGFHLTFEDNSGTTATTLGKDSSGNGNNFTPNNFSVASGAANDSVTDTPTNNFCVLNEATENLAGSGVNCLSDGNLKYTGTLNNDNIVGTMSVSSGKWYYEVICGANPDKLIAGWTTVDELSNWNESALIYYNSAGIRDGNSTMQWDTDVTTSLTFATNDVIGFALNLTDNELKVYENNSLVSTITIPTDKGDTWLPCVGDSSATDAICTVNFGQQGFTHTPPTGFKSLCTQNLPEPTIKNPSKYFNTGLYTGTGSSNAITGLGFQPDKVVVKMRTGTDDSDFQVFDDVRGANKVLRWNNQETSDTQTTRFTSFDSDGFTVGTENITNHSGRNFVYWAWKESASAGFDMVKYTGNGSSPRTVSHSLGVVPEIMMIKNMETNSTRWVVGNKTMDADENMFLNSVDDDENLNDFWASTRPTSSVFTVADDNEVNKSGEEHIAYLWASVEGMCKVGTYTGNGNNHGSFVHMGFRPSFFLVKNTNDNAAWMLYDDARGENPNNPYIVPSGYNDMIELNDVDLDIVSNGIKFRYAHNNTNYTENGSAYIYLAMARSPFKYANAR